MTDERYGDSGTVLNISRVCMIMSLLVGKNGLSCMRLCNALHVLNHRTQHVTLLPTGGIILTRNYSAELETSARRRLTFFRIRVRFGGRKHAQNASKNVIFT